MGSETTLGGPGRTFEPTLWSVVLQARGGSSDALGALIGLYWKPIYFFLRRRGLTVDEAKDLTQGFFAHLLEKDFLKEVGRDQGRFRTFLLRALENFRIDDARKRGAKKRGGGAGELSLDFPAAEREYVVQAGGPDSVSAYFSRQWALAVVARALDALRAELDPATFDALKPHLAGGGPPYEETAARLKLTRTALNNLIHRTRKRYRELIEVTVAPSVSDPASLKEELDELFKALKS